MDTPIYQVDAFTNEAFKGNPAAVCPLEAPRPHAWMQNVAAEMNLSETAFLVPREDGFDLRWFTPTVEVPLCGHATLASAHVLWETNLLPLDQPARFHSLSGWLSARRQEERIEMDFPAIPSRNADASADVIDALNISPRACACTDARALGESDYLFELDSEAAVREASPDFAKLRRVSDTGLVITARAETEGFDFVSRFFAPCAGIDEDPVTGAAHCILGPYWARRLGRDELTGYQASARGGTVGVRVSGERVFLLGQAVTVLRGMLVV